MNRGRVRDIRGQGYGRRFLLLAAVAFLLNMFNAPSSQLTNKYLTDVHHFSNSGIALFRTVTTGIPGLVGLVLGGRLAEARGRRPIAAIALAVATATQMVFFLGGGLLLWFMSGTSIIAASAGGIAIGTLGVELFPTETRSTSNGLLGVVGVFGSALGLRRHRRARPSAGRDRPRDRALRHRLAVRRDRPRAAAPGVRARTSSTT